MTLTSYPPIGLIGASGRILFPVGDHPLDLSFPQHQIGYQSKRLCLVPFFFFRPGCSVAILEAIHSRYARLTEEPNGGPRKIA